MANQSDVRVCMNKDNYLTLIERGREKDYTEHNYLLDQTQMDAYREYKDGTVVFGWNWIKWDRTYTDVAFVMNFLDEMAEEGYPYAFVRVGCETNDNEEVYYDGPNGEDDICHKIQLERIILEDNEEENENG